MSVVIQRNVWVFFNYSLDFNIKIISRVCRFQPKKINIYIYIYFKIHKINNWFHEKDSQININCILDPVLNSSIKCNCNHKLLAFMKLYWCMYLFSVWYF